MKRSRNEMAFSCPLMYRRLARVLLNTGSKSSLLNMAINSQVELIKSIETKAMTVDFALLGLCSIKHCVTIKVNFKAMN